jgi:hypothetical protein
MPRVPDPNDNGGALNEIEYNQIADHLSVPLSNETTILNNAVFNCSFFSN